MTSYNVHLYREMRLFFQNIEADTPDAAASLAREKATSDADDVEDCNGENIAALVDVVGDTDYQHSKTIEFEGERQRRAARGMLEALLSAQQALNTAPRFRVGDTDSYRIASLVDKAIAEAKADGTATAMCQRTPDRFEFTYEPEESLDRAYVQVDELFDVAIIRTDDGLVVDVYPKHGPDIVASTFAFASDAEPRASDAPDDEQTAEA